MKKVVAFRIDPDLLERAKTAADRENRTLTNFVETVLKRVLDGREMQDRDARPASSGAVVQGVNIEEHRVD